MSEIWLNYVVPTLGGITAITMFISPLSSFSTLQENAFSLLIQAEHDHNGDSMALLIVDPLAISMIAFTSMAFLFYGYAAKLPFVMAPNVVGLALGFYYSMLLYAAIMVTLSKTRMNQVQIHNDAINLEEQQHHQYDKFESHLWNMKKALDIQVFLGVLSIAIAYSVIFMLDEDSIRSVAGWVPVIVLVLFYTEPLVGRRFLFRTELQPFRSSQPWYISLGLAVTAAVNGALWVVYGFIIQDPFLWGPNAVGVASGVLQVFLYFFKK